MRAVNGEEASAPESGEMLAKRDDPADTAEATSGPHPEAETPCGMAPEKGNTEAGAGGGAAEAGSHGSAESTVMVTAAVEATAGQTDAESRDAVPTE